MRPLLLPLVLILAACAASNPSVATTAEATAPNVQLTADVESRRQIILTLVNRTSADVGYNLCTSTLERRSGEEWVPVPLDVVCTRELRILRPNQQDRYNYTIPRDLDPDEYRMVASVQVPLEGGSVPVPSNPFPLR